MTDILYNLFIAPMIVDVTVRAYVVYFAHIYNTLLQNKLRTQFLIVLHCMNHSTVFIAYIKPYPLSIKAEIFKHLPFHPKFHTFVFIPIGKTPQKN